MTKNIAHRGFSSQYPENTMLAFQKALELGCDGIELDVHLTRDGELVVIHDEAIDRTCDGKGFVRDFTLAELRRFNAHGAFPGKYGFTPIPTLREYFELVRDKDIITNIEMKNGIYLYPQLEEKTIAMITEFGLTQRVLFSSFNHCSMMKCKALSPTSKVAFLVSSWILDPGDYVQRHGADFLNPRYVTLTPERIRDLKDHGVDAQAWTVDSEEEMLRLVKEDIFAVITNHPERMKKVLAHLAAQ